MRQARVAPPWVLILAAAASWVFAVWSGAHGDVLNFWLGFAAGLALTWGGLAMRRRAGVRGMHSEHFAERGLLEDESDLALPVKPRPMSHYSGDDEDRPDLEDHGRP